MDNNNIISAANILFNHRLNKTGLKNLPLEMTPKNLKDSYKIQNEIKLLYLSLNNNVCIGKKIGCTNIKAQKQLEVFEPFYGKDGYVNIGNKTYFNPFRVDVESYKRKLNKNTSIRVKNPFYKKDEQSLVRYDLCE